MPSIAINKMIEIGSVIILTFIIATFALSQRGWGETQIRNLFSWETVDSDDGSLMIGHKALHVKLDVEDVANPKVYEFHMTDQGAFNPHLSDWLKSLVDIKTYFYIRNWNSEKCTLFTTNGIFEEIGPALTETPDNRIYYINAGTVFSPNIAETSNIKSAIKDRLFKSGCAVESITEDCNKITPGEFSICCVKKGYCTSLEFQCDSEDNGVVKQNFGKGGDYCNENTGGCPSEQNGGCCQLLREEASNRYTLKYGLMCGYEKINQGVMDTNAKWFACTGNPESVKTVFTARSGGAQYSCENGKWVSAADQGTALEGVQIRYTDARTLGDKHTELKFYVANHNKAPIGDVSIKAKIADTGGIDCESSVFTVNDCMELNTDKTKDNEWEEVARGKPFDSTGITCPVSLGFDDEDFCLYAKTFEVELKYKYSGSDKTDKFRITCSPKSMEVKGIWDDKTCAVSRI